MGHGDRRQEVYALGQLCSPTLRNAGTVCPSSPSLDPRKGSCWSICSLYLPIHRLSYSIQTYSLQRMTQWYPKCVCVCVCPEFNFLRVLQSSHCTSLACSSCLSTMLFLSCLAISSQCAWDLLQPCRRKPSAADCRLRHENQVLLLSHTDQISPLSCPERSEIFGLCSSCKDEGMFLTVRFYGSPTGVKSACCHFLHALLCTVQQGKSSFLKHYTEAFTCVGTLNTCRCKYHIHHRCNQQKVYFPDISSSDDMSS